MAFQPMRIQVGKNFTQNPGETDARSVAQSERAKPALLILGDGASGASSGAHSEETGKCRDSSKKRIFFDTQLPAHYIYSSRRCTQRYLQGRALLLLTQNKASLGRQAFLRGGWAPRGGPCLSLERQPLSIRL